ncbi:chorismate--pyruvate lyase family protein [Ferrimonas lipolytica]|uniref:Probable chorismate pyruvate-lyase n=1 Tax=Ferrimonas lipolytica TaxID=2724191 RepID=A0A6H1UHR4_9GAMM|nr:chorismate lyase [Ferrimonas lipolytica]QIZ78368.1 chorismate lyase [Ferrimonas lipolytica]
MFAVELAQQPMSPSHMDHWLTDKSSLTLRLKALCRRFEVTLLGEWQQPAQQDGVGWCCGDPLWLREVLLCLDGVPWVYALTEIPLSTLNHTEVDFTALGNRPLGEVLFSHQQMRAGQLTVNHYDAHSRPAQLAAELGQAPNSPLWGRSRDFALAGKPLRVNEVFLPVAEQRLR